MDKTTRNFLYTAADLILSGLLIVSILLAMVAYVLAVYALIVFLLFRFQVSGNSIWFIIIPVVGAAFGFWALFGLKWVKAAFAKAGDISLYFDRKKAEGR